MVPGPWLRRPFYTRAGARTGEPARRTDASFGRTIGIRIPRLPARGDIFEKKYVHRISTLFSLKLNSSSYYYHTIHTGIQHHSTS